MKKMNPFNGTFFVRRTFGYVFESFSLYCMNSQTTLESLEAFLARLVFSYIQNFSPLVAQLSCSILTICRRLYLNVSA